MLEAITCLYILCVVLQFVVQNKCFTQVGSYKCANKAMCCVWFSCIINNLNTWKNISNYNYFVSIVIYFGFPGQEKYNLIVSLFISRLHLIKLKFFSALHMRAAKCLNVWIFMSHEQLWNAATFDLNLSSCNAGELQPSKSAANKGNQHSGAVTAKCIGNYPNEHHQWREKPKRNEQRLKWSATVAQCGLPHVF